MSMQAVILDADCADTKAIADLCEHRMAFPASKRKESP
jgi:hypothetical protein